MTTRQIARRARTRLRRATGFDPQGGHYKAVIAALESLMNDDLTPKQTLNATRRARTRLRRATGYNPSGGHFVFVEHSLDQIANMAREDMIPAWRKLGPVVKGGRSLLDHSLTHKSSGLPTNSAGVTLWPAVDLAWGAGVSLYAPEDLIVDTKDSSARPGEAVYFTGASGIRHWLAHIDRDYDLGTVIKKGAFIGKTVPTSIGGGPHGHWAVNVEALIGKGKQLKYGRDGRGPDYTLGAPSIRSQLSRLT